MSLTAAMEYLGAGLSVLPACLDPKSPDLRSWKEYQHRLPTEAEVRAWLVKDRPLCLVTGAVSGNLEMIDFDCGAELFGPWLEVVRGEAPDLVSRLVVERSMSGGRHVIYRSEGRVSENTKLAQRIVPTPDDQSVVHYGKTHKPRKVDGRWAVTLTFIETRGEGGIFLCAPTPGYELEHGSFTELAVVTEAERDLLLQAAWSLNEVLPKVESVRLPSEPCGRPGDDYNERGDVREVLKKHGWTLARPGENECWRRPGKTAGLSATLKGGVFFVFSSNAAPFDANRAYGRFTVYALLEHEGDFARAASALRHLGYGDKGVAGSVDLSGLIPSADETPREETGDPGPTPEHLLRVPGFVGEVMDYTLESAPYPEPVLAFAGALTLQAVLAGRKVRDAADNRTTLYILALANAGVGKDQPRKVNQQILLAAGLPQTIGDKFASGEGIEDRLFAHPSVLFQTDEIDGLMTSINRAKDARHENVVGVLLKMYTSANAIYPMRVRAGQEPGVIDQPCLCLFGTAVPQYYYEALTVKMMTNGFVARQLILESRKRAKGRDVIVRPLPERVVATARWWADFQPGEKSGNLEHWHPVPRVVPMTPDALDYLRQFRERTDAEYEKAEDKNDVAGMAIWGRANEKARRLALTHACSTNAADPEIDLAAATWAAELVAHQTRRMLFMAGEHVSDSDFDARCKKLVATLRKWREKHSDAWMPFWQINRKLPWSERDHEEVRVTLENQRVIQFDEKTTGGRPTRVYRLL